MGTAETSTGDQAFLLRVLAGPAAFVLVRVLPLPGLAPDAHFAISGYAWIVVWWATAPVPWAVTSFLPFVLLPIGAETRLSDVAASYGHVILPYLMGVMLFGYAFQKHGLARRIALAALCVPGMARSGGGLVLAILVVSAVLSAVVSDLAVIVMMTPIALSVVHSLALGETRISAAASLAVLYGAAAGGLATPAGIVFNALTLSLLDQLTGYSVSFGQWVSTGVILAAAHIPVCYLILRPTLPRESEVIPDARARILRERKQLGPMGLGERNVLFVLILMLVLWTLPTVAEIGFLDIWYVPPVAMVLLFALPAGTKRGERTLELRDFHEGVQWNVLFLVLGGMAMADILTTLGVIDWLAGMLTGNVTTAALPWVAGLTTPLLTQLGSGAATSIMVSAILFPIADALGYNPAILARIISGTAQAVAFPWSSPASATTFSFGAVGFGTMLRLGLIATVLTSIIVVVLSMVLVPALQAFVVE